MSRPALPLPGTLRVAIDGRVRLLWLDGLGRRPRAEWFDPGWIARAGLGRGEATGRGATGFAELEGRAVVLRHYRRGGAVRRLLGDRYLRCGLRASRPGRELALLGRLHAAGLPVPVPVAARVVPAGPVSPFYRADLITERLPATCTLAEALYLGPLDTGAWERIGRTIARFHAAGVEHADLNAHNVLLGPGDAIYLVDFDRGRMRRPGRWRGRNLRRLRRSLDKLARQGHAPGFDAAAWEALVGGYRGADAVKAAPSASSSAER